jgi:hypothetical protein
VRVCGWLQSAGGGIYGLWVGLGLYHMVRVVQHLTWFVYSKPLKRALLRVKLEQRAAAAAAAADGGPWGGNTAMVM